MARPTYSCRVLVVGKTNLGEADLIITALKDDGSLLRAVAKGARKPSNPFAARLEIFSVCDCLIAEGKNLHVFSEAKTVESNVHLRSDFDLSAVAYPIVQAISKTCQEGLEVPRLFAMTTTALSAMDASQPALAYGIASGFFLKLFAMLGMMPNLTHCVVCGEERGEIQDDGKVRFSYLDGGYVCEECRHAIDAVKIESSTLSWSHALLMSTFADILEMGIDPSISLRVLELCHTWLRQNLGLNLKSLNALFSYGLASAQL